MPMVSMFIGEKTIQQLKAVFMEELKLLFPSLIGNYITHLQQDLDIEKIIKEKVGTISSIKLEAMILQMMSKELRLLQIAGAVLGFVIGLIQLLITQLAA